ncbi:MAG: DUF4198 domain-containing protein [Synergistaceae bacterium]|nr:DUF4198 domain-containing protein [Synergistaceae bacterium]
MKISRSRQNISRETVFRTGVFVTAVCLALTFAAPSLAGVFMVFPEYSLAPAGKTVKIESTVSDSLPQFGSSGYGPGVTISGSIVNGEGSENDLDFYRSDSSTGYTYTKDRFDGFGEDVIGLLVDSGVSYAVIGSSEGTSIVSVALTSSSKRYFSKAFINLTGGDVRITTPVADAGDGVLELVPATDIASARPGDTARFKLYLNGSPKSDETVSVSSNDVTLGSGTTDGDGEVELTLPGYGASPRAGGYCYVYSEVYDNGTTYQASLNFRLGSESISGNLVARNDALLQFGATMRIGPLRWMEEMGYTWARFLIDEPAGESHFIYGEDGQLEDTPGYSFTMPMDSAAGDLRGVSGVYSMGIVLTPSNIGQETYDEILRQIEEEDGVTAEGPYYETGPGFFKRNSIRLMARFADGAAEDMSDVFQCYLFEPDADGVRLYFGGLFTDSPAVGGEHYSKREFDDPSDPEYGEVLPFIFDGKADGVLQGEFWASSVPQDSEDDSSGGCVSGFSAAAALLAPLAAAFIAKRRRPDLLK